MVGMSLPLLRTPTLLGRSGGVTKVLSMDLSHWARVANSFKLTMTASLYASPMTTGHVDLWSSWSQRFTLGMGRLGSHSCRGEYLLGEKVPRRVAMHRPARGPAEGLRNLMDMACTAAGPRSD